ncbi:hypothetical protein IU487_29100 [Nocardia puris]|uniref:hypothetical protein n=1 Tax=Nocardia puris TaxID=208602 RepID=UPI00189557E9|nr:hypothetical protein [Nocardia puris]MBF6215064.1 hypothetical protein [Nocardia puris]
MDPVTAVVVSAIAAGAVAGVGDTATQVVKDTYAGLKRLLSRKYADVDVSAVEKKPDSQSKKDSLAEDLDDAGAAGDPELGLAAAAVLQAVRDHAPQAVVGLNIDNLIAEALKVTDIESAGDGVIVRNSTITGTAEFTRIRAGFTESPNPTTARD